jgi:hypothetical protein
MVAFGEKRECNVRSGPVPAQRANAPAQQHRSCEPRPISEYSAGIQAEVSHVQMQQFRRCKLKIDALRIHLRCGGSVRSDRRAGLRRQTRNAQLEIPNLEFCNVYTSSMDKQSDRDRLVGSRDLGRI